MGIACSDVLYSEPGFLFHFRLLWLWHTLRNIEVIPSSLYFNRAQKFFHSRRKWLTGVQTKWQNPRTAQNRNEGWTPADYFFSRDVSTPYHPNQYHIFYVLKPGKLFLQNHLFKKKMEFLPGVSFPLQQCSTAGRTLWMTGLKDKETSFLQCHIRRWNTYTSMHDMTMHNMFTILIKRTDPLCVSKKKRIS